MKKFRLPRKVKKKIKRGFYLYPIKNGGRRMGHPTENQKDYDAYKKGILVDVLYKTKAQRKADSIKWEETYHTPIEMSDEELIEAVNKVFAKEYRKSALNLLRRSKNHPIAVIDYYTFVNAYKIGKHSIASMTYDSMEDNLRRSKPRKKK
jgi:hypothetical protein